MKKAMAKRYIGSLPPVVAACHTASSCVHTDVCIQFML